MIRTDRIALTDTPVRIVSAGGGNAEAIIRNDDGANSAYLGEDAANATSAAGFEVASGTSVTVKLDSGDSLYAGMASTLTGSVQVLVTSTSQTVAP